MEVQRNVQVGAQVGVQAQRGQLIDGQGPAEQPQGQNIPASLRNRQRSAEVHHLTHRGHQRERHIPPQQQRGRIWRPGLIRKLAIARIPISTGCSGEYLQDSLEVV